MKANPRLAAILAVLKPSVENLSKKWRVDRTHLVDIKYGRAAMGETIAERFLEELGISPEWLQYGRGPVFTSGKSPGKKVESAVIKQLEFGPPRTAGVPVFESAAEAVPENDEGIWHEHPLRSVMPTVAAGKEGFFLRAASKDEADLIGCSSGDFTLFLLAKRVMRASRLGAGDEIVALVKAKAAQRLYRFELVDVVTRFRKRHRTGFKPPSEGDYDLTHVGADKTTFYLRKTAPKSRGFGGGEIVFVAIRAERDLIRRGNQKDK